MADAGLRPGDLERLIGGPPCQAFGYNNYHGLTPICGAISIREAARLQSFPDGFRFTGHRYRQIEQVGNAAPPLFAAAVARSILGHLARYGETPGTAAA